MECGYGELSTEKRDGFGLCLARCAAGFNGLISWPPWRNHQLFSTFSKKMSEARPNPDGFRVWLRAAGESEFRDQAIIEFPCAKGVLAELCGIAL